MKKERNTYMRLYKKIRCYAITHKSEDSVFSSFIVLLYRVFTSEYTQVFISAIGTIVIGIMLACNYYKTWFFITAFIYIVLLFFSAISNKYKNEKVLETKMLNQSLLGISQILYSWSICLQKCAKKIANSKKSVHEMELILSETDFQAAAFTVCEKLRNNLTKYCNNDDIYITVYQRYKKGDKEYCKMIAYSLENEPSSFNEEYIVPNYSEDLLGEIPYHSFLFSLNSTNVAILPDQGSIEKYFVPHMKNKEREEEIKQYIALPISPAKQGVAFILQVDTCNENLFGNNKKEIDAFVKSALLPYSHFLHMIYEESRTIIEIKGGLEK